MGTPIPAFYACYLLRSTVRHQSLYVGSTPHPVRRLRQHNGMSKGGAVRTSRDSLRPWEMSCLITGFPSKIAALQFEWAWQNCHLTRHIATDERLTHAQSRNKYSRKTGRIRKGPGRPMLLSLTERLANLHLLLRASSLKRWPLKVTFYNEDVFRIWEKWVRQHVERLRPGIVVELDESAKPQVDGEEATTMPKGIHALDVTYARWKQHLEKAKKLIDDSEWLQCAICSAGLPANGTATLICPVEGCDMMTHLECLSEAFIKDEGEEDCLVPSSGQCPSCKSQLQWQDLVKELSLRMRGEQEVNALFKQRRRKNHGNEAGMEAATSDSDALDGAETDGPFSDEEGDHWHELPDSGDEIREATATTKTDPSSSKRRKYNTPRKTAEPVIEDSDWDEAEVIS